MRRFDDFEDFFRYYISQHSKPVTRWIHFGATHAGAAVALTSLVLRRPQLLLLAPLATYGPAFASHWIFEKNSPVTLKGNALFAVRGDLRMISLMWRGRDAELGEIARQELERSAEAELKGIRVHVSEEEPAVAAS